ncbi:MAG: hypothetical protein HC769_37970 [Cyanobacteria bacterium CRU_2_1]|nr:hypothetical protein [Cyanobacteria bacterium CRU_2_1]
MRELEGDRPRTPFGTLNVLQLLLLNYTFTCVDNTLKLVTWDVNFDALNLSVGGDRTPTDNAQTPGSSGSQQLGNPAAKAG